MLFVLLLGLKGFSAVCLGYRSHHWRDHHLHLDYAHNQRSEHWSYSAVAAHD
jgi:hypothetical protein